METGIYFSPSSPTPSPRGEGDHDLTPLSPGERGWGEGNHSVRVVLAFLANLDEERGKLVNGAKDIGNGLVEFIDDVFAVLSTDGIVPIISSDVPLHASRFLRIVDLTAGRAESHFIALPI